MSDLAVMSSINVFCVVGFFFGIPGLLHDFVCPDGGVGDVLVDEFDSWAPRCGIYSSHPSTLSSQSGMSSSLDP